MRELQDVAGSSLGSRHQLRRLSALTAVGLLMLALPVAANATPSPVPAHYMMETSAGALESDAHAFGCQFANTQPDRARVLMLDFGAARKQSGDFGALSLNPQNPHFFPNSEILNALEEAADGYHNCHGPNEGDVIIDYGNSNYHLRESGMSQSNAHDAGYWQSSHAHALYTYESNHSYTHEGAAAGSDMELDWAGAGITESMVGGANDRNQAVYFDYGDAAGCPSSGSSGSCNNGWQVFDVGQVSFGGPDPLPLPEIYYTVNGDQWAVVRRHWNENHSSTYVFYGSTGSTGVGISAAHGWDVLNDRNPDVGTELICFGCG